MESNKIMFCFNFLNDFKNRRLELLDSLFDKGYEIVLLCPEDELKKYFIDKYEGIIFYDTPVDRRGKNPLTDLKLLFTYFEIIKKEKPDYIFSYTIKPNLYVGLVNMFFRKKFFPNVTGLGSVFANNNLLTKVVTMFYKVSFKSATKVFFQNEQNKQLFVDKKIIKKNKSILLPGSGVNLEKHKYVEYPHYDEQIRFVFLGRIMKEKGIYELITAFKELSEKYSNIHLDIYGFCEDDEQKFRGAIKDSKNISYKGFTDNVKSTIINYHALVLPSYHEGLSNVLLEASALGRPIIASDIPGCRETFDDGISGFGFESKNVNSLTSALIKFIELPYAKKIEMGLNARKKIEQDFDRNIVINKYLEQIER